MLAADLLQDSVPPVIAGDSSAGRLPAAVGDRRDQQQKIPMKHSCLAVVQMKDGYEVTILFIL